MPKAIWNGEVIAEARDDEVQIVENNVYFPIGKVNDEHGQLLPPGGGRQSERGRRLVLPPPVRQSAAHQGPHRLLARRRGAALVRGLQAKPYLQRVSAEYGPGVELDDFPYCVPAVRELRELAFHAD
eukprot:gene2426-3435_t